MFPSETPSRDQFVQAGALLDFAIREPQGGSPPCRSNLEPVESSGYEIGPLLSRGPFCEVFRATCTATKRDVVVKVTYKSAALSSSEHAELLIQNEASALTRLSGPNVVPLIATGLQGYDSYLVTEYAGDCDILDLLCDRGIGVEDFLTLYKTVLVTVSSIHIEGWVHGDLKPEHIRFNRGQPVLIDFGLATNTHSTIVQTKRIGGTHGYVAPEIIDDRNCLPEATQDVYSLGRILEDAVAGTPLSSRRRIRRIIQRATSRDTNSRYCDATQLKAALDDAAHDSRRISLALWASGLCLLLILVPMLSQFTVSRESFEGRPSDSFSSNLATVAGLIGEKPREARRLLEAAPAQQRSSWVAKHLQSRLAGSGIERPFGDAPFEGTIPVQVAYDRHTDKLVWGAVDGAVYCLQHGERKLLLDLTDLEYAHSIDHHPASNELLLCTALGHVYTISDNGYRVLQGMPKVIEAWYSQDGNSIYGVDRESDELVLYDLSLNQTQWRTPLNRGVILRASSDPDSIAIFRHDSGSWSMVRVSDNGTQSMPQAIPMVERSVLAYDHDEDTGQILIGSYNGNLHYFDGGMWHPRYCGETRQAYIVRLVADRDLAFAVTPNNLEVFNLANNETPIRLGTRQTDHFGIRSIHWCSESDSLEALTRSGVTRWSAGHSH